MAAQPIDFQVLSDKILKILELALALCTAVFDLCLVILSYVYRAFWAVAHPSLKTFSNQLVTVLIGVKDYAVAHPIITLVILFGPGVLSGLGALFLHCLGFKDRGVRRGSYAAKYQSTNYGGSVPKGSAFAWLQSQTTKAGS